MKFFLSILSVCLCLTASAQNKLWNQPMKKDAYLNQLEDGKLFVKNEKSISLLDHKTGEKLWTSNVETDADPQFLRGLPLMYFADKSFTIIDASSGKEIVNDKVKTEILDIHYHLDQSRIIFEISQNKNTHLFNLNLKDVDASWQTELGKTESAMFGLAKRGSAAAPSVADEGSVAMIDKKYINVVDKNGKITNKIEFDKKIEKLAFNPSKNILYVLEDGKKLHFVDIISGKTNHTVDVKDDDLDIVVVADGKHVMIREKKDIVTLHAVDGAEINRKSFDDKVKAVYYDDEIGKYFVVAKKVVVEIDPVTGKSVNEAATDEQYGQIYRIGDEIIVSTNGKANVLDLKQWKMKYSEALKIGTVQDYIETGSDRIYTSFIGTEYEIVVVDAKGEKLWNKTISTNQAPSIDIIGSGILVISDTKADHLGLKDGKSQWDESISLGPSYTYELDEAAGKLVMYADKRIYTVDLTTGRMDKSEEKLKFKDFDYATQKPNIFVTDKGYFIKGSNSVFITNKKGKIKHNQDYKRSDNSSTWMKLANTAIVLGAVGSGNADKVVTVTQGDNVVHQGSMVEGLSDNWAYADQQRIERQQKQNQTSAAYPYVFTKLKSGKRGLIFIDPDTGKDRFDVLMTAKSPIYILDEVDGVLFYINGGKLHAVDVK